MSAGSLENLPDISCVGALRRLSRPVRENHYIGFDTEDDGKGHVISCAFYDGRDFFYTRDPDEAITYILNYPVPSVFAAHNLEYDIGNLFKHCNYIYIDEMPRAGRSGRLIGATLKMSKHTFVNSNCFFAGTVRKMGELVGLPKLDGDPLNPEYNKRDAEIVQVFMDRFQRRVNKDWGVSVKSTIGQLAMSIYRARYMRQERVLTFNHADCLKAYYGGRVEVFYKGTARDIVSADINSCYPYVMKAYPYPDSEDMGPSRLDTHEFGVGEFTVEVPKDCFLPPLPWRSPGAGRLFFPTGRLTGWWTYAELRAALACGCRVLEEKTGWGTRTAAHPFTAFVDDLYARRLVCKDALDRNPADAAALFDSVLLKLIGNNLYGKFSQHAAQAVMTRTRWTDARKAKLRVVEEDALGPFYSYIMERDEPPATANFIWGVYVTSYARIYWLEQARKVVEAGATLLYGDTDSFMYTRKAGSRDPAFAGGNALGALKEERFDLGIFRQSKGYLLCNRRPDGKYQVEKSACKGVPAAHALEFIIQGMASFTKPFRLREGLRSAGAAHSRFLGDVGVNIWHDVSKTMQSVYIKRRGSQGGQGVTKPVDVTEIPGLEENCFQPAHSIALNIKDLGVELVDKPREVSYFVNVTIPKNWKVRGHVIPPSLNPNPAVMRLHWFSLGELAGLEPGATWFAGQVLTREPGKHGDFLKIQVMEYLGQILSHRNFFAALPEGVIPEVDNLGDKILNKKIAVRLSDTYILDSLFLELEIL